ncbi:GNAT family N-acetyltransferase [Nostoc sp. MS1]|uniref:GNAT family N-acetyltransferase n=1 Tax=Nostoc sp. MS1 TaxID=2764711 RepID=UPI001CC3B9E3|nr:GNAT family N-acetyltransferase [Nostoc sp. MS1]
MSSSEEPPVKYQHPPSGYSLRRGTLSEIQSHNLQLSRWINIVIRTFWAIISIRIVVKAWLNRLPTLHQAYLYEYGKLPNNLFLEDLKHILPSLSQSELPLIFTFGAMVGLAGVIPVGMQHILSWLVPEPPNNVVWVAEYQQKIAGWAVLSLHKNYSIINILYITPKHRSQGVGSHLLWHCLQNIKRPIYLLICDSHLKEFYARFGFIPLSQQQMPREFQSYKLLGMGLFNQSISTTNQPLTTLPLPPGISIHPFRNLHEQWQVYRQFWHRKRFRVSRLYVFTLVALISSSTFILVNIIVATISAIFSLTWLARFDFSLLGMPLSGISIAVWLVCLSYFLPSFAVCWKELVVEQDGNAIAYVHFSNQGKCSVLYNIHIEPQYQQQEVSK